MRKWTFVKFHIFAYDWRHLIWCCAFPTHSHTHTQKKKLLDLVSYLWSNRANERTWMNVNLFPRCLFQTDTHTHTYNIAYSSKMIHYGRWTESHSKRWSVARATVRAWADDGLTESERRPSGDEWIWRQMKRFPFILREYLFLACFSSHFTSFLRRPLYFVIVYTFILYDVQFPLDIIHSMTSMSMTVSFRNATNSYINTKWNETWSRKTSHSVLLKATNSTQTAAFHILISRNVLRGHRWLSYIVLQNRWGTKSSMLTISSPTLPPAASENFIIHAMIDDFW